MKDDYESSESIMMLTSYVYTMISHYFRGVYVCEWEEQAHVLM